MRWLRRLENNAPAPTHKHPPELMWRGQTQDQSGGFTAPAETSNQDEVSSKPARRDIHFWLVFLVLCCSTLISALDLAGVAVIAPTMVHDLHGSEFTWVAAGYNLSMAALLPLSGNLANIFGRKSVLLSGLATFGIGSAVCGSAKTMRILITGRVIQGIGGASLQALTTIIISDLVPLRERGLFTGVTGLMWSIGGIVAPFISGALTERASWRWFFYMNIPLCAIAILLVIFCLKVHTPQDNLWQKVKKIDWIGNAILIGSTVACLLALSWAGVQYSWSSSPVIAPLVAGLVGFVIAICYELTSARMPMIPHCIIEDRMTLAGVVATFVHGFVMYTVGFYLATWFQAAHSLDAIHAGVYILGFTATISPGAIIQGLIVSKTGKYWLVNIIAWVLALSGIGAFIAMKTTSHVAILIVCQILAGSGLGMLYATVFVTLAPLPVSDHASALTLLLFVRQLAGAWGISIAGTTLQSHLNQYLPENLLSSLSAHGDRNADLAYSIIPLIPTLPSSTQGEVKRAFEEAFKVVWIVMAGVLAFGVSTMAFTRDIRLHREVDGRFGLKRSGQTITEDKEPEPDVVLDISREKMENGFYEEHQ